MGFPPSEEKRVKFFWCVIRPQFEKHIINSSHTLVSSSLALSVPLWGSYFDGQLPITYFDIASLTWVENDPIVQPSYLLTWNDFFYINVTCVYLEHTFSNISFAVEEDPVPRRGDPGLWHAGEGDSYVSVKCLWELKGYKVSKYNKVQLSKGRPWQSVRVWHSGCWRHLHRDRWDSRFSFLNEHCLRHLKYIKIHINGNGGSSGKILMK